MAIQHDMFEQFKNKALLRKAHNYAEDYLNKALARNVFPTKEAIANLAQFDEDLPEQPAAAKDVIKQLHQLGSPATVTQIGGRYFGMVNGGIIPTALAAKFLVDVWDQNTPLYVTSPINAKLESICEKWLIDLLDLPQETVAGFVSGSTMAIVCGLAAGRYRLYERMGWDINKKGLRNAPEIRIIMGEEAHSAVKKAVSLLGLGTDNIEYVPVDNQGRMLADQLPELDDKTLLVLQAGNVSSGAFDPFEEICEKAQAANAWVHIDGAFGLWAAASTTHQHLCKGIGKANSWSVDGHKTLNTPYDSGLVLCNDSEALVMALQATAAYLLYGEHRDGMMFTPEMSKRARAIELWATLKYLGRSGVSDLVKGLCDRALQFKEELEDADFEVMNEVVFNQVIVPFETIEIRDKMVQHLQDSGVCWCGGSTWKGRPVIRISVCSWATTKQDVTVSVEAFMTAREELSP